MSVPLLSRGGQFGTLLPFEPLTAALAQRGIVDGTVVTPDIKVGGNLRSFNPNLRIVSQESYRLVPVPRRVSDDRSCVLVWSANDARGLALAGTLPAGTPGRPIRAVVDPRPRRGRVVGRAARSAIEALRLTALSPQVVRQAGRSKKWR